MRPLLMRHSQPINESFKVWRNHNPYRHNPWHYHPECEVTYIFKGKGVLFIGDQMLDYSDDDMLVIGPDLPHEWRSDNEEAPDLSSDSISLHFDPAILGEPFYALPEAAGIKALFEQSSRGIRVTDGETKRDLGIRMKELLDTQGFSRVVRLLEMLKHIAECKDFTCLASNSFADSIDTDRDNRINQIYEYVMKHLTHQLSIKEAASLVNMTPTSFCRFFKDRTHKSFIEYVNEFRVGYACRLLIEGKLSVSQAAHESGFDNLSHFNKQFKKIKHITPTQFVNARGRVASGSAASSVKAS